MKIDGFTPFATQLDHYWKASCYPSMPAVFFHKVNKAFDQDGHINSDALNALRKDELSSPLNLAIAEALANAFADDPTLAFGHNERTAFLESARRAIDARDAHSNNHNKREAVITELDKMFSSSSAQTAKQKKAAAEHEKTVKAWRSKNPPGRKQAKSFVEMLDETYRENGRLNQLFGKLLENWSTDKKWRHSDTLRFITKNCDPGAYCLRREFYVTHARAEKPLQGRAVNKLAGLEQAFALTPSQTLQLWRIAAGSGTDLKKVELFLKNAEDSPDCPQSLRALMFELNAQSGLSSKKAAAMLGEYCNNPGTYNQWVYNGQRPGRLDQTIELVELLLPGFVAQDPEHLSQIKSRITKRLSGINIEFDLDEVIQKAKASEDPKKSLYTQLFGKNGCTGVSTHQIAEAAELSHPKMMARIYANIQIDETLAKIMADFAGANEAQTREMVTLFTGVSDLVTLLKMAAEDKDYSLHMAMNAHRTRTKTTKEQIAQGVGVAEQIITNLETKGNVSPDTAKKYADFFFNEEKRESDAYYHLICMGLRKTPTTPAGVLENIKDGTLAPLDAFDMLLAFRGYKRSELARALEIKDSRIRYDARAQRFTPEITEFMAQTLAYDAKFMTPFSVNFTTFKSKVPISAPAPAICEPKEM